MASRGCCIVLAFFIGPLLLSELGHGQDLLGPLSQERDYNGVVPPQWLEEDELRSDLPIPYPCSSCPNTTDRIVRCLHGKFYIIPCYCLIDNDTLGYCQFTCFRTHLLNASTIPDLIEEQCSSFNRSGKLCGSCKYGTAPPAYSFSLRCVPCEWNWRNLVKYIAVAYVPLTIFLLLLMIFRVSVNSAPLLGYIFVAQISTVSFQMRLGVGITETSNSTYQRLGLYYLGSAYGIWNLDFFRTIFPPFCLHPGWNFIEIMSLEYIISSYPFIIILLTYTIVKFYSRGYRVFCWWKPVHWCLSRLRNEMNIKTSLVDAFGTFFSLSYAKTLNTTFDILAVSKTWKIDDPEKNSDFVSYYAATEKFKLEFVILGLSLFIIFNVLPIIVLFFYSLRTPVHHDVDDEARFIQPLANALLTPYRDGSNGGWNCRWFCVVYLVARILIFGALQLSTNVFFQFLAAIICLVIGMLVAVIKPYKTLAYNTVDTVLMLSLALAYTSVSSYYFASFIAPASYDIAAVFCAVMCNIPLLYFKALIVYHIVKVTRLPQKVMRALLRTVTSLKVSLGRLLVKVKLTPPYDHPTSVAPASTSCVTIESGTVRVSSSDLSQ